MKPKIDFFATNSSNAFEAFESRRDYADFAFSDGDPVISLWGRKFFYGRKNFSGETVVPRRDKLGAIQLTQNEECIDFVSDAFNDFVDYYNTASRTTNKLIRDGSLTVIRSARGYDDPLAQYERFLPSVMSLFYFDLRTRSAIRKISTFGDFLFEILLYLQKARDNYISYTAFIESRFCSVENSGISVEIASLDHSNDTIKEDRFLKDPNFIFYMKLAEKFGFRLDRDAPWRLVADLRSPAMLSYQEKRGYEPGKVFDNCFETTYSIDQDSLPESLLGFWNSFVASYPSRCRRQMTEAEFTQAYNDEYWSEFFMLLRKIETSREFNVFSASRLQR